jgi:hypothetical protein
MLPFYKLSIDDDDDTGVNFNAFVDSPAHQKGFIAFSKEALAYSFNDEKRIVTGVMISANTPIYRSDSTFGEHYVLFDEQSITKIKNKFHKQQHNNNVNLMHDANRVQDGVYMVASYQIGGDKNPSVPQVFANQNLQDGTWIASYKVDNDEVWNNVKDGKFLGFSVEGNFFKDLVKIKTNDKMSKKTKSIWELMGLTKAEPVKVVFSMAVSTDGVEISYEGELAEGVAVFITTDGTELPAPEGDYQVTLEDGTVKAISVDANGIVMMIADGEVMADDETPTIQEEVATLMSAFVKDTHERFTAIETKNTELVAELAKLKEAKESKFVKTPVIVGGEEKKLTIKDILNKQK